MTNTIPSGDLLAFSRDATRRRLIGLSRGANRMTPYQLTFLGSILDMYERKSRAETRSKADHPAAAHLTDQ